MSSCHFPEVTDSKVEYILGLVTENVNKLRRRRRRGKEKGKMNGTEQSDIELDTRRAEKGMEVVESDGRAS